MVLFFFSRRGHTVLQQALPPKQEFIFLVRMSPIQRTLYREFMNSLQIQNLGSWANTNPLKAFAVCCKVKWLILLKLGWNFVLKFMGVSESKREFLFKTLQLLWAIKAEKFPSITTCDCVFTFLVGMLILFKRLLEVGKDLIWVELPVS